MEAPPTVVAHIASVNGAPHIFLANFGGLVPLKIAVPTPETNVRISIPDGKAGMLHVLPFLGEDRSVQGERHEGRIVFVLPALERGAVAWFEDAK